MLFPLQAFVCHTWMSSTIPFSTQSISMCSFHARTYIRKLLAKEKKKVLKINVY